MKNSEDVVMSDIPLVSICCLTYNHVQYVAACLDGFLSQKTTFGIEILVHDDASTDGTTDIIKDYAEKYPEIIFPLYEEENQYSKYHGAMDIIFNYSRARGKYIAYCEGDDYWTDPLKLQKQVDFLESHPEYSVCFHRCSKLNELTGTYEEDNCSKLINESQEGVDLNLDMFFGSWITQPLSMVFRVSAFDMNWYKQYKYYRDQHEIYHLLQSGKGYLFGFNGGVYRIHPKGIQSMISKAEYCAVTLPIDKEFYRISPSNYSKQYYLNTLQECITLFATDNKLKAFAFLATYLSISGNFKTTYKLARIILRGGE